MSAPIGSLEPSMKLVSMQIQNFMRVQALQVEPDGSHLKITGPNGSGKTSAIDALFWALSASDANIQDPVRRGADKASVVLDLGEIIVERTKAKDGPPKLTVKAKEGNRISSPQTLLDSLIAKNSLDPVSFLERRPQDQLADVLAVCGVAPPVAKVKELTGETINAQERETAAEYLERVGGDGTGIFYGRRRDLTRDLDQKRAAVVEQKAALERLGGAVNGQAVVSVAELAKELERLNQDQLQRSNIYREFQDAESRRTAGQSKLKDLKDQLGGIRTRIEELEREIATERAKEKAMAERIANGEKMVLEMEAEETEAIEAYRATVNVSPKIAEVRQQIQSAEYTNATIQKRLAATETLRKTEADLKDLQARHKQADDVLEAVRSLRKNILQGVDLGVPGLEVGAGELLLDGISFKQASTAQRIRVACAVAMKQSPRLKLLRVDEGERLDRASRETLFAMAEQNGWQVVMTSVADTEGLAVEIVEGGAK